jgi:hypothetical protein
MAHDISADNVKLYKSLSRVRLYDLIASRGRKGPDHRQTGLIMVICVLLVCRLRLLMVLLHSRIPLSYPNKAGLCILERVSFVV